MSRPRFQQTAAWLIAILVLAAPVHTRGERRTISLDGLWDVEQGLLAEGVPTRFGHQTPVPGTLALAQPPFAQIGQESSRREVFWLRRTFQIAGPVPEVALLKIHKAKYGTQAWLNGTLLGEHLPCFTPGYFDVQVALRGNDEPNELLVRLGAERNSVPASVVTGWDYEKTRYYPGIYDRVELILTGAPHLARVQVGPDIVGNTVRIQTLVRNRASSTQPVGLRYRVYEKASGKLVAQSESAARQLLPGAEATLDDTLALPDAHRWSPEDPFLYALEGSTGRRRGRNAMRASKNRTAKGLLLAALMVAGPAWALAVEMVGEETFLFHCEDPDTVAAYKMALEVVAGNIQPWQRGLLEHRGQALMAGKGYASPWTRDASYNTYFGVGLIYPEVAKNTLLSVLQRHEGQVRIGGQYWDSIAWVTGAWEYYLYTGDETFLRIAYDTTTHTLAFFEQTEFDLATGLFRGPGWSDGVAGYPAPYHRTTSSFILDYARDNESIDKIRLKALSTNCLYYNAYRLTAKMGRALNQPLDAIEPLETRAAALKRAINERLWMPQEGRYAFFLDRDGQLETSSESLGQALAILFEVASAEQAEQIFRHQFVSPHGIPCSWPIFPRFGDEIGRHSGAVWPQIQGFWALAAASKGRQDLLAHELLALGRCALASGDFREIYHPFTGLPDGGLQVGRHWNSEPGQTWAATAYLAMLYRGVVGMRFDPAGITFQPALLERLGKLELQNVKYRQMRLDIGLTGRGTRIVQFSIDQAPQAQPRIAATLQGRHRVDIQCTEP